MIDDRQVFQEGQDDDGARAPLVVRSDVPPSLVDRIRLFWRFAGGGMVIVTGMPGMGKDMFANWLSYAIKTVFENKKVFRDERPKWLFGDYEIFNEAVLREELENMSREALGIPDEIDRGDIKMIEKVGAMTKDWLKAVGESKLHNGVLYLTEFWRYCHNRRPHNPMGILLGSIIKQWRHLDLLIIGSAQQAHELDRFSVLPYVTHQVRCSWGYKYPTTGTYRIKQVTQITADGVIQFERKVRKLHIDGARPRAWLGGERIFDLYVSKSKPQIIIPKELV